MSLLDEVHRVLLAEEIPHALVGAAALALHGHTRATADADVLVVSWRVLDRALWTGIEGQGATLPDLSEWSRGHWRRILDAERVGD